MNLASLPVSVSQKDNTCCIAQLSHSVDLPWLKKQLTHWHSSMSNCGHLWLWCNDSVWNPQPVYSEEWAHRFHNKRNKGITPVRVDGSNYNAEADIYGGIAEDFVARLLGKQSDRALIKGGGFQDLAYYDLVQGRSLSVDVKWSSWSKPDAYLKVNAQDKLKDIYVLVTGQDMTIRGVATRAQLQKAKLVDWGYGQKRSLPCNQLHPFSRLVQRAGWIKPGEMAIASLLRLSGFSIIAEYPDCYVCIKTPPKPESVADAMDWSQGVVFNPLGNCEVTSAANEFGYQVVGGVR